VADDSQRLLAGWISCVQFGIHARLVVKHDGGYDETRYYIQWRC